MKRRLLWIAAVVLAGFGALGLRIVLEGRAALAEGDAALAAKRPVDALAAWESAARWYLPGAPHVGEAYDRMRGFAEQHKSVAGWRAIRSAARATRTLWQPHADDLALADRQISELGAIDPERAPAGDPNPGAFAAWHARVLAADPRPGTGSVALAIAGIVCWLAGMAGLLRRQTLKTAAIPLAGIALWALGLYTA
jgi:hypothetical protein